MKLQDIIKVLPEELAPIVRDMIPGPIRHAKRLHKSEMVLLEKLLFEVQDKLECEHKGRRPVRWIATLNDIRNVILDELEINNPRPHLRWPNVERMKKRMM